MPKFAKTKNSLQVLAEELGDHAKAKIKDAAIFVQVVIPADAHLRDDAEATVSTNLETSDRESRGYLVARLRELADGLESMK